MEAPPYSKTVPKYFKYKFNWTLSYRRDSDVPVFYGEVKTQNRDDYRFNKTSSDISFTAGNDNKMLAAWMISKCRSVHSKRWEYVNELRKYIPIDIFGRCGTKCGKNENTGCSSLSETHVLANNYSTVNHRELHI